MRKALLMLVVMLPAMFSGCFGEDEIVEPVEEEPVYPQPWERADLTYIDSDVFSRVTVNGTYGTDDVRSVYIDVPTITAADGGAGLTGDALTHEDVLSAGASASQSAGKLLSEFARRYEQPH